MSELISERFQRLPAIQQQREQEYQQQAREASYLVHRMDQTRQEAERVAIAEIESTKRMMEREVRGHPDWLAWRRQYEEVGGRGRQWDAGRGQALGRLQEDLDRVRREVDAKGREYDALLAAQERNRSDRAAIDADTFTGKEQLVRLEQELSALKQQEDDLNHAFADHNSAIVRLNKQLTELRQDISRKERDNAVKQHQQQSLQDQIKAREHELDHLDTRIGADITKKTTAEQNKTSLGNMEASLSAQLAQIKSEPTLLEEAQVKLKEAQENQRIAITERDRFSQEQRTASGNLAMLSGDVRTLHNRQQAITEEINKLMEERRAVEALLMEKEQHFSDLQDRLNSTQDRNLMYQERVEEAEQVVQRAQQLFNNYQHAIREQEERQQQLNGELKRVRLEGEKSDRLVKDVEEDLSTAHSTRRGVLSSLDDLNRQLSSIHLDTFEPLVSQLNAIQQEIDKHQPIANQYREQLRGVQSKMARVKGEVSALQNRLGENEKKLRSMPSYDDEGLAKLNQRTQQLSEQVTAINQQIQQYQTGNPHSATLKQLQSQEAAIRSTCWDAVKNSPSSAIRKQLSREAEAVMRAEAAVACCRKQQQVESEAQDLARFHLEETPRVVLDEQATNVMLSECTGRRPKHEIAGIVLDMCEQRHIQISH